MDDDIVPVVFRVWRTDPRECIALFPSVDYDGTRRYCNSYAHIGQHGGADYQGVISQTRPAKPNEYAALKRELEGAPFHYKLKVYNRKPKE